MTSIEEHETIKKNVKSAFGRLSTRYNKISIEVARGIVSHDPKLTADERNEVAVASHEALKKLLSEEFRISKCSDDKATDVIIFRGW